MSGFRLYSLKINSEIVTTSNIDLIDNEESTYGNYFSLIIGNNGTGKSRILVEISKYFKELKERRKDPLTYKNLKIKYNIVPSKIITISNSSSNKFPIGFSYNPNPLVAQNKIYSSDLYYHHLGIKNRLTSFPHARKSFNRTLEIILDNYSDLEISRNYRSIFNYLEYEPIIKVTFEIKHLKQIESNEEIFDLLFNKIESYIGYRNHLPEDFDFIKYTKNRIKDLYKFLLSTISHKRNTIEVDINFSSKNIERINRLGSPLIENLHSYELINILRKLNIIGNYKVEVFKKDGVPFNFENASSGEANILSNLLSLTPLIEDNSLILIDEPEISLHPLWQAKYIDLLNKVLENFSGCHIIIATHSPFLASDLNPKNSCVIKLENKKRIVSSSIINKSTYGWSDEDILLNVFGMETTRNFDLYKRVSDALDLLARDKKNNEARRSIQKGIDIFYPSLLDSDPIKSVIEAIFKAISYER